MMVSGWSLIVVLVVLSLAASAAGWRARASRPSDPLFWLLVLITLGAATVGAYLFYLVAEI